MAEPEEEACGNAKAPGYVVTCYKCCGTELNWDFWRISGKIIAGRRSYTILVSKTRQSEFQG